MFNRKENRANKDEIKKGEKILKNIMGGNLVRNREFGHKLALNGFTARNINQAWRKINKQIKNELKNGELKSEDVEKRIDEVILELSGNDHIITTEEEYIELYNERQKEKQEKINESVEETREKIKQDILNKGKISIEIPYQSNGVNSTMVGGAVFGTAGLGLGAFDEGSVKWKHTDLILMDNGLNVKSTGAVVLYEDIKDVVLGKSGFLHTVVTIVTKDRNNFIFKIITSNSLPLKRIIEDNLSSSDDGVDALLKYAELFEKGLLTKEEFDMKKQELL